MDQNRVELISENECTKAVCTLQLGKAPGKDNVTVEMLKYMGKDAKKVLIDNE